MEDLVRDQENFQNNSLFHWEPVQTLFKWSNVSQLFCFNSQPCGFNVATVVISLTGRRVGREECCCSNHVLKKQMHE